MATQGTYPPTYNDDQQGFQPQYGQQQYGQQQYPAQQGYTPGYAQFTNVVTTTPGMGPTIMVTHVNDYMGLSIFTLLCCCLPLGIAAIVNSCEAQDANAQGDMVRAQAASGRARTLNFIALGLGIFSWIIGVILIVLMFTGVLWPWYIG